MTKILARIKRSWHCLLGTFGKHRSTTMWVEGRVTYVGCECGRVFYMSPHLTDRLYMAALCKKIKEEKDAAA